MLRMGSTRQVEAETTWEAFADGSDRGWGGSSRDIKKWSDSGCSLKAEAGTRTS